MFACPDRAKVSVLAIAVGLIVSDAHGEQIIGSVGSPNGQLTVDFSLTNDGNLAYAVKKKEQEIIAPSRLGLILANAPKLDRNFSFEEPKTSAHDETWEQPWGERRSVRNHYNEIEVTVVAKDDREPQNDGGLPCLRRRIWFSLFISRTSRS